MPLESPVDPSSVPAGRSARRTRADVLIGIALPLGVAGFSYGLWRISDQPEYIGPLDKAAFGWSVVFPIWVAASVLGGLWWRRLAPGWATVAATVVGLSIGIVAAVMFYSGVADPSCEFGAIVPGPDWPLLSGVLGAVVGGSAAANGWVVRTTARRRPTWQAVLAGSAAGVVLLLVAILVGGWILITNPVCNRP